VNRYHLVHVTEFRYEGPVSESYNEVRLRPIHDERQSCLSFRLATNPASRSTAYRDFYGNWVHQFNILPEHRHLRIETEAVVLAHDSVLPPSDGIRLTEIHQRRSQLLEDNFDFVAPSAYVPHLPQLSEIAEAAEDASNATVGSFAQAASQIIHERFRYVKGATHVHSSIADSLSLGVGVCQDFAHLLLGVVRLQGIPARYVSGYLVPGLATAAETKQEEVIGGQASHAWVEVFSPTGEWIPFDPTLGKPVGLRHVRVAYGRDYGDVAPVRGVYKGHAGQRLSVDVRVRPVLDEEGREQMTKDAAVPNAPQTTSSRPHQQSQQQQ
jgi:transglutaminase-like putative cysteine protease